MKLVVKCTKCKHLNKVPHSATTRIEYAKNYGSTFELICEKCGTKNQYTVDDIKAKEYTLNEIIKNRLIINGIIIVIGFILGIIFKGIVGGLIFSILALLFSIFFMKKNNRTDILNFNKHKLKGRISNINYKKK